MNNIVENLITLTPAQLMDDNQRMSDCYGAISTILRQYGCELQCSATIDHEGKFDYIIKVVVKKGE